MCLVKCCNFMTCRNRSRNPCDMLLFYWYWGVVDRSFLYYSPTYAVWFFCLAFEMFCGCCSDVCVTISYPQNLVGLFCAIYTGSALPLFCLPWVTWSRCRLSFQNRRFVTAVMRTGVTSSTSRASAFPVRARRRTSSAYGVKCSRHTIACNWRYDRCTRFRLLRTRFVGVFR